MEKRLKKNNIYIFLGPPGSGKGSLSNLCVSSLGWLQLSTGNLCRKHIAEQTDIGKKIDFAIKSGKLISDNIISLMVENWLTINLRDKPIIMDGYPRTILQAKSIIDIAKNKSSLNLKVIKLIISDQVILNRLLGRLICKNIDCQAVYSRDNVRLKPKKFDFCDFCSSELIRRSDDEQESIRERLFQYSKNEKDLVNFFEENGQGLLKINAENSIDLIFEEFKKIVFD